MISITRKIGFDVIFRRAGGELVRETVKELTFGLGKDFDLAKTTTDEVVPIVIGDAALVQFTGEFDKDAAPIFHGDVLADEAGNVFEVMFYNGMFMLRAKEKEEGVPLTVENTIDKKVVGDLRTPALLLPDTAEAMIEASTDRRIEKTPPFVNIKL